MRVSVSSSLILGLSFVGLTSVLAAQPKASPAMEQRMAFPASDAGLPGAGPIRRSEWFREKWVGYRSDWAQRIAQDQNAIVFFGDSITDGWGRNFGGCFPGLKVANRGINGDTTRGLLIRIQDDVLALHPRAVVLLIGTNDIEEQAEPETIAGNLQLILAAFQQHNPRMPVILCQVFPSSPEKRRPPEKIKRLNELYAATVKGNTQVTFLETWPLFANAEGNAKLEEFPDLLHPNAAGYAKWAAALRPLFATMGVLDTEPDAFTPEPGFVSLFNGRDLTGWSYRATSEVAGENGKKGKAGDPKGAALSPYITETVRFDGLTETPDGRFAAINGRLVAKAPPEPRKIQQLWTTREFPRNFVLKLEFRATPNADSGIFLRGPQLQCRDYLLAGPFKELQHYRPQDWNEIVVTVSNGLAQCTCNGELLTADFKLPAVGPIGLEGDRGQMEYRHIRLQELPENLAGASGAASQPPLELNETADDRALLRMAAAHDPRPGADPHFADRAALE